MHPLPLAYEFFRDFWIAGEETPVAREKPEGSVRWFIADHEISHRLVIVEIFSTDRTFEFNPHCYSFPNGANPHVYKGK